MTGGIVDGGGHAGEVRVVQPGDGVLQVEGYSLAQAGDQLQQAALGSFSALMCPAGGPGEFLASSMVTQGPQMDH
jgi:hypothetical protein